MDQPDRVKFSEHCRKIITSNLDELAQLQSNKNRRYVQLAPGELKVSYMDASLGNVQIFKESFNLGLSVLAAPSDSIIPFGIVLPDSGDFRFCGQNRSDNSIIQAGGGSWDVSFKATLAYMGCALLKDYFDDSYLAFTGKERPRQFLVSKLALAQGPGLHECAISLENMLHTLHARPEVADDARIKNLMCSQAFKLLFDVLQPSLAYDRALKTLPKRIQGAKRVVEYLQAYAADLPDIQTLCKIANLSERSLQYGFMEYLGLTPIQYLRIVRLNGARAALLNAEHHNLKVSDIALKWGFLEFGRFSREYKQLFMELPSQTLRTR